MGQSRLEQELVTGFHSGAQQIFKLNLAVKAHISWLARYGPRMPNPQFTPSPAQALIVVNAFKEISRR